MSEVWFTEYAEELASCLIDAERCADVCERLVTAIRDRTAAEGTTRVVRAVVAPTAVARVLVELVDQPPELVLATARLCVESAQAAAGELESLAATLDVDEAVDALRACAGSCGRLAAAAE